MTVINSKTEESSLLVRTLSWLVTLLVPIALTLTAVRLMLAPYYVRFEYNAPGFPTDRYGFTTEERLHWADLSRLYLLNAEDITFLSDLHFEDGQPIYNERELGHMVDVKNVVKIALNVWVLTLVALTGLGVWARFGGWWAVFKRALGRGGWLSAVLVGVLLLLIFVSFGVVFVAFHNVFFAAGTWTFNYSDTLIRLFPERFWRDIFILVGGLVFAGGLGLGLGLGRKR